MVEVSGGAKYIVRVQLPDRPGALGAIATRVGAVRGDLVGIEILERGDGRVIDELVIQLPGPELESLLIRELSEVDGVVIDDVISIDDVDHDPQSAAFEVASVLLGTEDRDELLWSLCTHIRRTVRADWVAVVGASGDVAAHAGPVPGGQLTAAATGPVDGAPADPELFVERLPLPSAEAWLLLGRLDLPFRAAERRRAAVVARLAGTWWNRLAERARLRSMMAHPSGANQHQPSPPAVPAVPDTAAAIVEERV
ncbi:MAG: hypothetical protein AAGK32_12140 [Actinomycetota bacterium]